MELMKKNLADALNIDRFSPRHVLLQHDSHSIHSQLHSRGIAFESVANSLQWIGCEKVGSFSIHLIPRGIPNFLRCVSFSEIDERLGRLLGRECTEIRKSTCQC